MSGIEHGIRVGLSDHTPGIGVPIVAGAMGAFMIEKHFTLSRADGGQDAEFSLEPHEFKQMVEEIKRAQQCIGVSIPPENNELRELRRSLYFCREMKAGETITKADIVTARPALGDMPKNLPLYIGRKLAVDVEYAQPVKPECVL